MPLTFNTPNNALNFTGLSHPLILCFYIVDSCIIKKFDPFSISIRCLQTTIYAQLSVSQFFPVCTSKVTIYVLIEVHVVVMRNFMLSIMKSSFELDLQSAVFRRNGIATVFN